MRTMQSVSNYTETRRVHLRRRLAVVLLLLLLFSRLLIGSRKLSFTADEPSHIASGYAYLARGATWTVPLRGHPLLLDAWLALPFYLGNPDIPLETLSGWEEDNTRYVQAFVPYVREKVLAAEVATRVPVMLLTMLLAAVVVRWTRDLFGLSPTTVGSLGALLAISFDPTLLAHGMLATNDIGTTALGTTGLWLTHRFVKHPKSRNAALAGLILGLTVLSKGSGIIWLAGALSMVGLAMLRDGLTAQNLRKWSGLGLAMLTSALLTTWAFYGFQVGSLTIGDATLTVPAAPHWKAILGQSAGAGERWTYFLGRVRRGGDWRYFPAAVLLKNPPALLILAGWGAVAVRRRSRTLQQRTTGIWAFPVLYTAVAIWSGVNIGYRHMAPVHPFLYLLIGALPFAQRLARALAILMIAWLGVESMLTGPFHISYFTPLVGGATQGWRYLADSNTDWGQGYKDLATWQNPEEGPIPFSGPNGYIGMQTYDVDLEPLPPIPANPNPILKPWLYPAPGTYVISADSLSGLGLIAPDNYAWFRYHRPADRIVDVLNAYEVPPLPDQTWLAQCSLPIVPLDAQTVVEGFPVSPSRDLTFDCSQTWVYPVGEEALGWYALHAENLRSDNRLMERLALHKPRPAVAFTARRVASLAVSCRQWDYRDIPAFVLWEHRGSTTPPSPQVQRVFAADAGSPPVALNSPVELPQPLEGPLTFLGIDVYRQGTNLEVETWWRVAKPEFTGPASIMAHLLDEDGQSLGVADGLGVPPDALRSGDVLVQSHTFAVPEGIGDLWFRAGAYWLDDGARWPIAGADGDAFFAALGEAAE